MFDGAVTPIIYELTVKADIVCNFNLKNYPFDIQYCSFTFILDEISSEYVKLYPKEIAYKGKTKLSEYEISNLINDSVKIEGYSGLTVTVEFKNMYTYYITSTYIPTILLVVISYLTFWFEIDDFNDRIMVSLTSLLVLASLFSQISSGLPHTSYLKLIDIWFLGCIVSDFIIILSLVIVNRKIGMVNPLKHKTSTFLSNFDASKMNYASKISIICIFILFFIIYVISILVLQNQNNYY